MHRNMGASLDRYIMGEGIHDDDLVEHHCPGCENKWKVRMFYELGGWFYVNDDDSYCSQCGGEGCIVRD